jgi:hypothetical protein
MRLLSVEWAVFYFGPGHIVLQTAKIIWLFAAQSTSECGLSYGIEMRSQCILGALPPVLGAAHV